HHARALSAGTLVLASQVKSPMGLADAPAGLNPSVLSCSWLRGITHPDELARGARVRQGSERPVSARGKPPIRKGAVGAMAKPCPRAARRHDQGQDRR